MNNQKADQCLRQCQYDLLVIQKTIKANQFAPINSFLCSHAIVRASGAIEMSLKAILIDFCSCSNVIQTNQYLLNLHQKKSYSISYADLLGQLSKFDDNWKDSLKNKMAHLPNLKEKKYKTSWNSLINERHKIAHGALNSTPISIDNTIKYFLCAKRIIRFLDKVVS